jgi:hypothetical protein
MITSSSNPGSPVKDKKQQRATRPTGASSLYYFSGVPSPQRDSTNNSSPMKAKKEKEIPQTGEGEATAAGDKKRNSGSSFFKNIKSRRLSKTNKDTDTDTPTEPQQRTSIFGKKKNKKHHHHHHHGAGGAGSGDGSSPFLFRNLLSESDRQNKLRMCVKILTLVVFSPFFALQWGINKCATANQHILDWAPSVVDVIYQHVVSPITRFFVRVTSAIAGVWHSYVFLPLYTLFRYVLCVCVLRHIFLLLIYI